MFKRYLTIILALILLIAASAGCRRSDDEPEKKSSIELKITGLTVSDKIDIDYELISDSSIPDGRIRVKAVSGKGEKTESVFEKADTVTLDAPAKGGTVDIEVIFEDENGKTFDKAVLRTKDGLVQLTDDSIPLVVAEMTDVEKAQLIAGTGNPKKAGASGGTYEIERLGVPSITVNDGPAGVRYGTSVWYPSVMNMTSSWDGELINKVGRAMGEDSLALGIDIVLAPGMNIQKNVLGGRNFEYCSEDPLLTAFSASAYVKGMQSAGAGACLKHFVANEQETSRGSVSSTMTERALREIYLKPFQLAVRDSSPVSIMSSYNQLNGIHNSINKELLTGILRAEWGYKGMVMTDWGAAGAIEDKVNALNDIYMPGGEAENAKNILAGLKTGRVDREALDKCCEHILYAVTQSPTFRGLRMNTEVDFKNHSKISEQAGCDTIVLLKNDNEALPLSKGTSVAVFGNGAYRTRFGGSGSGGVTPSYSVNIVEGIENSKILSVYDESGNVFKYSEDHSKTDPTKDAKVTESYASSCAKGADAAVIVISRDTQEGADNNPSKGDFLLNDRESEMIRVVSEVFHAAGKKVVVLINTGNPVEVCSWRDLVDAVVFIGYPGQNAGNAVAAVLSGDVNPSAKTTMSWPVKYSDVPEYTSFPGNPGKVVYYEDIYAGYRYYNTFDVATAYPFGYGLSYTTFEYSGFGVKNNGDGTFELSVTVTNNGKTQGREVVEFYVSKPETVLEQPERELCGFKKTNVLKPGKSETVKITVTGDDIFSYDSENSRYIVSQGDYTFYACTSSEKIHAEASAKIEETRVVYDVENRCAPSPEPPHITKSGYKKPAERSDEDIIASELTGKNNLFTVDLGGVKEVGAVLIDWEKLEAPFVVLTAGEDGEFSRFDVFASEGLNFSEINLHGKAARFIRIRTLKEEKVTAVRVYAANEEDKKTATPVFENIALKKKVKAASVEGALAAAYAVDGNLTSRWGSLPSGESWLRVDLGEVKNVKGILLYLEAAWVPYRIEYSTDGENYTTLASFSSGEIFVKLRDLDFDARYVRFIREGESWFSIYEAEIYG